jgi:hypothetical protein
MGRQLSCHLTAAIHPTTDARLSGTALRDTALAHYRGHSLASTTTTSITLDECRPDFASNQPAASTIARIARRIASGNVGHATTNSERRAEGRSLAIGRFVILDLVWQSLAEISHPKPPFAGRLALDAAKSENAKSLAKARLFQVPPDGLEPSTL